MRSARSATGRSATAPISSRAALRRFVPLAAVIVVLIAAAAVFFHRVEVDSRVDSVASDEGAVVETLDSLVIGALSPVVTDLGVFASLPPWTMSIDAEARDEMVTKLFVIASDRKGRYDQVRFLDVDGQERVRVDRIDGESVVVAGSGLQNKADRYYFVETMALDRDEVFISRLDLNVERGELEIPYQPMIRAGTPVFDAAGDPLGVVIINFDATGLLDLVEDFDQRADGEVALVDGEGYWLAAPDPALEWGWMTGATDTTFAAVNPDEWAVAGSEGGGQFETDLGFVTFSTFDPTNRLADALAEADGVTLEPVRSPSGLGTWTVVSVVPASEMGAIRADVAWTVTAVAGPVGLVLLLAAWFIARSRVRDEDARRERSQAAAVFDATSEGIIVTTPEGTTTRVNRAFEEVTGLVHGDVIGERPEVFVADGSWLDFAAVAGAIATDGEWHGDAWVRGTDGEPRPISIAVSPITDADGTVQSYVGIVSDISSRHVREARLRNRAFRDELTGLPNRAALVDALDLAAEVAGGETAGVGVLFLDLDGFKEVNDSLGHKAGDELLVAMGDRIRSAVRDADMLARLGGDEFVVLLADIAAPEMAERAAERIIDALGTPFDLTAGAACVSASIGIAMGVGEVTDPDELLDRADRAMYEAKRAGRATYRFDAGSPGEDVEV